jgi:L-asparaginase
VQKPRLLLISAGGTISMERESGTGRSVATLTAAQLLARATDSIHADIRCVDLPEALRLHRRPADLLALARWLQREMQDQVDGVVITHGTDTLEEIAYYIDEISLSRMPIIFTGAMRPAWATDYDGIRNVENALRLALGAAPDHGVLVTMNNEIFEAWSVYKSDTGTLNGFTARRGAPSGRVIGDEIELNWRPTPYLRFGRMPPSLPPAVPILTMGVGDDAGLLDLAAVPSVQGIVLAGMGVGSIPPVAYDRVVALAKRGTPVVLCSSATSGNTAEEHYYPGAYDDLRAFGIKIENHLNARKTRIRLLLSLGLGLPYVPFGEAERNAR